MTKQVVSRREELEAPPGEWVRTRLLVPLLRSLLLLLVAASAAGLSRGHASAQTRPLDGAPVLVANRQVIVLRGPIAGYTAKERVDATTARIERVLKREHLPKVSTVETANGTQVLLGGNPAFLVTRIDIDESIGETTTVVAGEAAKRLKRAIQERREQETPRYLARALVHALGATLLYGLLVWLLVWLAGRAGQRLSTAAAAKAQKLQVKGVSLLEGGRILRFTQRIIGLLAWLLGTLATVSWLAFVLERFPQTRRWGEELTARLVGLAHELVLGLLGAVPGLAFLILIFLIARGINRVAGFFLERLMHGEVPVAWADYDQIRATRRIIAFVVWVFAVAMAYPYFPGAQTEAFKGLSVLVGLMVSLGGSSLVSQAASGLTLMYSRNFRRGDHVRVGEAEGTVVEIGMFATRLRTGLGEEIVLPSSLVMTTAVTNYSRVVPGTGYVVDTVVTIGYGTPWRQVHAMLEEAALRTPDVTQEPAPIVRQTALGDFYVEYRLAAYTPVESPRKRAEVLSELHGHIQDVFNEYGVQIMSPHYQRDPNELQVVAKEHWYRRPARPPTAQETDVAEPRNGTGTPPK